MHLPLLPISLLILSFTSASPIDDGSTAPKCETTGRKIKGPGGKWTLFCETYVTKGVQLSHLTNRPSYRSCMNDCASPPFGGDVEAVGWNATDGYCICWNQVKAGDQGVMGQFLIYAPGTN